MVGEGGGVDGVEGEGEERMVVCLERRGEETIVGSQGKLHIRPLLSYEQTDREREREREQWRT